MANFIITITIIGVIVKNLGLICQNFQISQQTNRQRVKGQIKLVLHVLCEPLHCHRAVTPLAAVSCSSQLNNVLSFKTVQDGNAKTFLHSLAVSRPPLEIGRAHV